MGKLKNVKKIGYHDKDMGLIPPSDPQGGLMMGIELEYEFRLDRCENPEDSLIGDEDYMSFQDDGSLNDGVECVTRPDSIRAHVANLYEFFRHNRGLFRCPSHAGMHVHIPLQEPAVILCMRKVLYDVRMRRFYQRYIAKRRTGSYWSFGNWENRYTLMNVQNGERRKTQEFRLFSSTYQLHRIYRRLNWIDQVVKYAKKEAESLPSMRWVSKEEAVEEIGRKQYKTYTVTGPWHEMGFSAGAIVYHVPSNGKAYVTMANQFVGIDHPERLPHLRELSKDEINRPLRYNYWDLDYQRYETDEDTF